MKLGQMLSIQDESIVPPTLTRALAQVRRGADGMPTSQLATQLEEQWGRGGGTGSTWRIGRSRP
ncbi:hypothetical protein ACHAWF_013550 [Thalassiosira exigua]